MYPGEFSAMWGFLHAQEQKAGTWLQFCGSSFAFQRTKVCLWWQSLLLLFFVIGGCNAHVEKPLGPIFQSVQEKFDSESLLKSHFIDEQHLISKIPSWKLDLLFEALQGQPIYDWVRNLQNSTKVYKNRLFKRTVKYIDDQEFESLLEMVVKEAVKKVLAGRKAVSDQSRIEDPQPHDDNEEFPSEFLQKYNGSDDVIQPQQSLNHNPTEQDILKLPTTKSLSTSKSRSTSLSLSREQDSLELKPTLPLEWFTMKPVLTSKLNKPSLPSIEHYSSQSVLKPHLTSNPAKMHLPLLSEKDVLQSEWSTVKPHLTSLPAETHLPLSSEKDVLQTEWSTVKPLLVSKLDEQFLPSSRDQDSLQSKSEWSTMNPLLISSLKETFWHKSNGLQSNYALKVELSTIQSLLMRDHEDTYSSNEQTLQPKPDLEIPTMKPSFTSSPPVHSSSELQSLKSKSLPQLEWSTLKTLLMSNPVGTSLHSYSEQGLLQSQPALQLTQSVTALPIPKARSPGNIEMHTKKLVAEVTTVGSDELSLGLQNIFNDSPMTQESADLTTKYQFPTAQHKDMASKMGFRPVFESSSIGNALTSSSSNPHSTMQDYSDLTKGPFPFKQIKNRAIQNRTFKMPSQTVFQGLTLGNTLTSTKNPELNVLPITQTSPTRLINTSVSIKADLFSHDINTSLAGMHDDYTSNPATISPISHTNTDWRIADGTIGSPKLSVLPTKRVPGTSMPFISSHKFTNYYKITRTTGNMLNSLEIVRPSINATMSYNLDTQTTSVHTSVAAETSEHDGNMRTLTTPGTLLISTSSSDIFGSAEVSTVLTEAVSFQTHYERFPSDTPLPIIGRDDPACVLKVHNATMQMLDIGTEGTTYKSTQSDFLDRLKSTLNTDPLTYKPSDLSRTVGLSLFTTTDSSNLGGSSVSLIDKQSRKPTELPHSSAFSLLAGHISFEPTELPNTVTPSLSEYVFYEMNGNDNSNKTASRSTSVHSLKTWPSLYSTLGTSITPEWKSARAELHVMVPENAVTTHRSQKASILLDNATAIVKQKSLQTSPTKMQTTSVSPVMTSSTKRSATLQPKTYGQDYNVSLATSGYSIINAPTKTPAPKVWEPLPSVAMEEIHITSPTIPSVVAVPLNFQLTGVSYSKELGNHTTEKYKRLEREVVLLLNKVFATKYQQEYLKAEVLGFLQGSVIVRSNVVFDGSLPTPSGSNIVRTVISDDLIKNNYFGWNINTTSVECQGYNIKNLESDFLPLSFLVLHAGYIAVSQKYQEKQRFLDGLQKEVLQALHVSFPAANVSFSQIRDVHGDLEVKGILYVRPGITDVQAILSSLLKLANTSVDLQSIAVGGMRKELLIQPIKFRLINTPFVVNLLDMDSPEFHKLSKDLSLTVQLALHDDSLLQVVVREFSSGSVVCKGDLIYRLPSPGSGEILRQFLQNLRSDGTLGSSDYRVDLQSITIGDSSSRPNNGYIDFPGFGVAIIVMCGLFILLSPVFVYMCYKNRIFGHRNKATIQRPHDPDEQNRHFEMDNRAFRESIEQP